MDQRMRRVLDGGPSDHDAFLADLWLEVLRTWIRVVTYNAAKFSGEAIEEQLATFHHYGPDVLLLQEIKRKWRSRADPVRRLRRLGYRVVYARPEYAVAWDPVKWERVRHYRLLMSPTEYWTFNYALVVVLRHRATGELVKFVSGHPPAHVQKPSHPSWPKVMQVLREWVDSARRIGRRNRGQIAAVVFGLDLNVDVTKGWEPKGGWDFIDAGPLDLVVPPKGTHHRRRIDVFLVRGAKAAA